MEIFQLVVQVLGRETIVVEMGGDFLFNRENGKET
jgi:hypothetical protein